MTGVVILLLIILGLLSLGNLGGSIFWLAFAILITLFVLFVLALIYLAKTVVSMLIDKATLQRFNPDAAEKILWPLLIGMLVIVFLIELSLIGWLLNFVLTLIGLERSGS